MNIFLKTIIVATMVFLSSGYQTTVAQTLNVPNGISVSDEDYADIGRAVLINDIDYVRQHVNSRSRANSKILLKNCGTTLVGEGLDARISATKQTSLLHLSAALGRVEIAEHFLKMGADPNSISRLNCKFSSRMQFGKARLRTVDDPFEIGGYLAREGTPLSFGIIAGTNRLAMTRMLLSNGADVALSAVSTSPTISVPIVVFAMTSYGGCCALAGEGEDQSYEKWRIVMLLIENGADVNASFDYDGTTSLLNVLLKNCDSCGHIGLGPDPSFSKRYEIFQSLVSHGYRLNDKQDEFGRSALHYAAKINEYEILQQLLKLGFDPNKQDSFGRSPIRDVSFGYGNDDTSGDEKFSAKNIYRLFLENGADPNQKDDQGITPSTGFFLGKHKVGSVEKAEAYFYLLEEYGGNLMILSNEGLTIMDHAVAQNRMALVEAMLDRGISVDWVNGKGQTPLFSANGKEMLDLLVSRGANLLHKDSNGESAADVRSRDIRSDMAKELVKNGVPIKKENLARIYEGRSGLSKWELCDGFEYDRTLEEALKDAKASGFDDLTTCFELGQFCGMNLYEARQFCS